LTCIGEYRILVFRLLVTSFELLIDRLIGWYAMRLDRCRQDAVLLSVDE